MPDFTAIVLSAGSGKRMQSDIPKQYMDLLGKPVIYYSLQAFQDSPVDSIVLVAGKEDVEYCRKQIVERYGFSKVKAIVCGGKERYDSVLQGLRAAEGTDYCMIHDGARPLLTQDIISRLMEAVTVENACVPGMPVKDTIKVADDSEHALSTPDRRFLWQIQTPQTFSYPLIRNAYEKMAQDLAEGKDVPAITDDAMVAEYAAGCHVLLVKGSYENIKITTPEDLDVAALHLQRNLQRNKNEKKAKNR